MLYKRIITLAFMLVSFSRIDGQEPLLKIAPELYDWSYSIGESQILPAYIFFRNEKYSSKNIREVKRLTNDGRLQCAEVSKFDKEGRIIAFDYILPEDSLINVKDSSILFRYTFQYNGASQVSIRFDSINSGELSLTKYIYLYYGRRKEVDSVLSWRIGLGGDTIFCKKYIALYDDSDRLLTVACSTYDYLNNKTKEKIVEQYTYLAGSLGQVNVMLISLVDNNRINNKSAVAIIKNEYNNDHEMRNYTTVFDSVRKTYESICLFDDTVIYLKTGSNIHGSDGRVMELQINYNKKKCHYKYLFQNMTTSTIGNFTPVPGKMIDVDPTPMFEKRIESMLCICPDKSRFRCYKISLGRGSEISHIKQKGIYNSRNLISKLISDRYVGNARKVRTVQEKFYYY